MSERSYREVALELGEAATQLATPPQDPDALVVRESVRDLLKEACCFRCENVDEPWEDYWEVEPHRLARVQEILHQIARSGNPEVGLEDLGEDAQIQWFLSVPALRARFLAEVLEGLLDRGENTKRAFSLHALLQQAERLERTWLIDLLWNRVVEIAEGDSAPED